MNVIYDKESDALSIMLSDAKVAESDEARTRGWFYGGSAGFAGFGDTSPISG
ncbi:MAG: DUF2283 domain-containing protein [Planctomycetes bacterium]|nr:DUF2283 domain-containing protein [Planctomycetota bacterium]